MDNENHVTEFIVITRTADRLNGRELQFRHYPTLLAGYKAIERLEGQAGDSWCDDDGGWNIEVVAIAYVRSNGGMVDIKIDDFYSTGAEEEAHEEAEQYPEQEEATICQ